VGQADFILWACALMGLSCDVAARPNVSIIQSACEREATSANSPHDKGLRVIETACDDGADARFLCQVTFLSNDDPSQRLDANKAILREGARRPAFRCIRRPPLVRGFMMNMVRLEQGNQHADVEQ
jgi:hypothetical protein